MLKKGEHLLNNRNKKMGVYHLILVWSLKIFQFYYMKIYIESEWENWWMSEWVRKCENNQPF